MKIAKLLHIGVAVTNPLEYLSFFNPLEYLSFFFVSEGLSYFSKFLFCIFPCLEAVQPYIGCWSAFSI